MRHIKSLILLFPLFIHFGCKTVESSPSSYEKSMIVFGSGGGFSGIETSYTLLENGYLFSSDMLENSHQMLGEIDAKVCKQMFENFTKFQFDQLELNQPGNTYKYLEYKNNEESHKITWESTDNNYLQEYYKILSSLAQSYSKR